MPTSKVEIKERISGHIIKITTTNGTEYRISILDGDDSIEITANDGALSIIPRVSNQILINTERP